MTPLLQQAIHLLQLSTLELKEVVEQELSENPLLEEVQAENGDPPRRPAAPSRRPRRPPSESPLAKEPSTVDGGEVGRPALRPHLRRCSTSRRSGPRSPRRSGTTCRSRTSGRTETSLTDHLMEQLRLITDEEVLLALGESIIGNLDEDGYLRAETASSRSSGPDGGRGGEGAAAHPGLRPAGGGGAEYPGVPAPPAPRRLRARTRCPSRSSRSTWTTSSRGATRRSRAR